jgi:propionyl-CoA carboxylase beta chain
MFVTGPEVVKTVTNEEVTKEQLGGAKMHSEVSGVCHNVFENDIEAIAGTRKLLNFLPQNNRQKRDNKAWSARDEINQSSTEILNNIIPQDPNKPYDMLNIISAVVDRNDFYQIMPTYARNIVTGFAEVEGKVVGIVGNQPQVLAGCLDIDASQKAARFIRFCDSFNVPLVTFTDVPGFLPGTA